MQISERTNMRNTLKEFQGSEEERLQAPAVSVSGVGTSFFHFKEKSFKLQDISFTLERGYILGLIGRNGSGKSTLLRILLQSIPRKRGSISIAGYDAATNATAAKRAVGYVGEDLEFFTNETLLENGRIMGGFFPVFHEKLYLEYLERFELSAQRKADRLSKGEATRAALAFALSHEPELLLLDEPTGGLDPLFRQEFLTVLQESLLEEKMGIIFSTHITEDLDKIADYVMMLEKGRMLFYKSKEELWEELKREQGEELSLQKMMYRISKEATR